MAQSGYTPIVSYHSTTPGAVPAGGDLTVGEMAVNVADRTIYVKNGSSVVVALGGGATGGGADEVFNENQLIVTTSYTLSTNKSAMSVGPITVNSGVVVTIPSGYRWVIL